LKSQLLIIKQVEIPACWSCEMRASLPRRFGSANELLRRKLYNPRLDREYSVAERKYKKRVFQVRDCSNKVKLGSNPHLISYTQVCT